MSGVKISHKERKAWDNELRARIAEAMLSDIRAVLAAAENGVIPDSMEGIELLHDVDIASKEMRIALHQANANDLIEMARRLRLRFEVPVHPRERLGVIVDQGEQRG